MELSYGLPQWLVNEPSRRGQGEFLQLYFRDLVISESEVPGAYDLRFFPDHGSVFLASGALSATCSKSEAEGGNVVFR
ncbi:MAG: hypothetical protein AAF517_21775 [Planctomycetota bacterium]